MRCLIIGTGAQGRLVADILRNFYDIKVVKMHTDITTEIRTGIVAIGDNKVRKMVVEYILELMPDFNFINAIHPESSIDSDAKIGTGVMIMRGAMITKAVIKNHCLINTGAIIDHDNIINDFCNITPGAIVASHIEIGAGTTIAIGAIIRDHVKIGKNCIIGMGAVVTKDVPNNSTVYGNPAKQIIKKT